MKAGDFSTLAEAYSLYRPDYSQTVLKNLSNIIQPKVAADVGAGTGIWTRMLQATGLKVTAVEPNDPMRAEGEKFTSGLDVVWKKGSAEETTLEDSSVDWLTMASSFHWANLNSALSEFRRVIRPGGYVTVLWNPRDIQAAPLHQEIEDILYRIVPDLKRVSSGSKSHVRDYLVELSSTGEFKDVFFMEAPHVIAMSKERYIGVWRSVNDVQQQAGPERFELFLKEVGKLIEPLEEIIVPYKTRAWTAQRA